MKYKVGDMVKVVARKYGHGLDIGGVYEIERVRYENNDYFINVWCVRDDEIEPYTEPTEKLHVGEKYTSLDGCKWECIFVDDGLAWMRGGKDHDAYVWNALTGENISQGGGEYNIKFTETRKGTVEYVNGKPDFSTWTEDE